MRNIFSFLQFTAIVFQGPTHHERWRAATHCELTPRNALPSRRNGADQENKCPFPGWLSDDQSAREEKSGYSAHQKSRRQHSLLWMKRKTMDINKPALLILNGEPDKKKPQCCLEPQTFLLHRHNSYRNLLSECGPQLLTKPCKAGHSRNHLIQAANTMITKPPSSWQMGVVAFVPWDSVFALIKYQLHPSRTDFTALFAWRSVQPVYPSHSTQQIEWKEGGDG